MYKFFSYFCGKKKRENSLLNQEQFDSLPEPATKSNFWKNVNIIGKIPGSLGTAFLYGLWVDAVFGLSPNITILSLSTVGLITGSLISAYATPCGIYCEYKINKNNESTDEELPLMSFTSLKPRSYLNYFVLIGLFLDQAADKGAALGAILHIVGGDEWSRLARALTQSGVIAFGAITSPAEVITADRNIREGSVGINV